MYVFLHKVFFFWCQKHEEKSIIHFKNLTPSSLQFTKEATIQTIPVLWMHERIKRAKYV